MSQRRPEPCSDSSQEEAGMKGVKEWGAECAGAPIKLAGFRLERGEVGRGRGAGGRPDGLASGTCHTAWEQ